MAISLHSLTRSKGRTRSGKRLGRGLGSAKGKTGGRGQKGQKSRSGASGFQRRAMKRMLLSTPKLRGFKSQHPAVAIVNIGRLNEDFEKDALVNIATLKKCRLIASTATAVKVLGQGEINHAIVIQGCTVSQTAVEKITKAGGSIK